MRLTLEREPSHLGATHGRLACEGEFLCYTLEDEVRERAGEPVSAWKIPGATAIPAGTYHVTVTLSPRFRVPLPLLVDVPGFSGVRIHAGNDVDDTEGCILVGLDRANLDADGALEITRSREALALVLKRLTGAMHIGEPITLTITNPRKDAAP